PHQGMPTLRRLPYAVFHTWDNLPIIIGNRLRILRGGRMNFHRMPAPRWLWTAAALILVMVALSPVPANARQFYTIKRISVSSTGVQGINIQDPVINSDGSVVAFWSDKEGLVPGDTNFAGDIFVH